MDPIVTCVEDTLLQSVHPALRLSELLESVGEKLDRSLDAHRLRSILEAHPDRFRILQPWRGLWRSPDGSPLGEHGADEPWVVAIHGPGDPPDGATPTALRLRESVRWLARGVDARSPSEVSRWYAIALSEREVRSALLRRAA